MPVIPAACSQLVFVTNASVSALIANDCSTPIPTFFCSPPDVNVLSLPAVTVTGTVDVNVTNSPLGVAISSGSIDNVGFTALNQSWSDTPSPGTAVPNGNVQAAVIALPGYNTVTPTVNVGVMAVDTTTTPFNVTPVVLMLWDSSNNQWRAAACSSSGYLLTSTSL